MSTPFCSASQRWFVPLVALLPALAGCSDGGGGDGGPACDGDRVLCDPQGYFEDHFCVKEDVRPRVYAPDTAGPDRAADPWLRGDWWEFTLRLDGRDAGRTKLVYYGDQDFEGGEAQHYMVGTPTRDAALLHALDSTNPVIGRVHRALYSPHEQGAHADMFNFPLCAGNAWSTRFFGEQFQLQAAQADVRLPGGTADPLGFRIAGTSAAGSRLSIDYSPEAKWFTALDLDRAGGGGVDMRLVGHGGGYRGPAYFLRAQQDEAFDLSLQPAETAIPREAGGEGAYDKVGYRLALTRTSGDGKVEVHLRDPAGTSVACVGIAGSGVGGATTCPRGPRMGEVAWQEGEWTLTIERPLIGQVGITGEAQVVSIYDRSGSV